MNAKLENYIAFHDNKIKEAKIRRMNNKSKNLNDEQKEKIIFILNYIKSNPESALENKIRLKGEIQKILSQNID